MLPTPSVKYCHIYSFWYSLIITVMADRKSGLRMTVLEASNMLHGCCKMLFAMVNSIRPNQTKISPGPDHVEMTFWPSPDVTILIICQFVLNTIATIIGQIYPIYFPQHAAAIEFQSFHPFPSPGNRPTWP